MQTSQGFNWYAAAVWGFNFFFVYLQFLRISDQVEFYTSFLYFVGQLAYHSARHFSFLRNWNFIEEKDTFCLQLGNI